MTDTDVGLKLGVTMEASIDVLLRRAVSAGASDIHLKEGSPPIIRIEGELRRVEGESLQAADTEAYAESIFTPKAAADFKESGSADFAYGGDEMDRFRVTAFRQRGSVSMILRRVVHGSKSFAELGLPRAVEGIAASKSGLVLVTGPSGSGKSATVSSILDWINRNRAAAIVTIEDPIEVLHPDKRSVVVQREVGVDTNDMAKAVRGAMRHDTDVIMISEIADAETAEAAMDAAETGHLVISTMRTTDPADTVNRLVSMFNDSTKALVRTRLATQTKAIISQLLIDNPNNGLVLVCEVLTNNERAQEWIMGADEPSSLVEIIKDGGFFGMQTFDQAILKHVVDRTVELDSALSHARNVHELRAKANANGIGA